MGKYYIEIGQVGDWYMFDEGFETFGEALTRKNEAEKTIMNGINMALH